MKILITGSTGLLGQALVKRLAPSHDVVGLSRRPALVPPGARHVACDLTDARATKRALRALAPEVVIHTQALSDVDRCDLEPREAERQNVGTVEHLYAALRDRQALVVLLSTDYVFDGRKASPYDETDEPRPLSVYGRSKLAAERIALAHARSIVIRPSTIFGPGRVNFCDEIVQRARAGKSVEAFEDQTTSPTYSDDLAEGLEAVVNALAGAGRQDAPRVLHLTNAGGCRRTEFARLILELLGCEPRILRPIRMEEQARPAKRPAYSALTSRYLRAVIGRTLRPWDEALHAYLRQRRPTTCLPAEGGQER